jgi:ribosome-associated protein
VTASKEALKIVQIAAQAASDKVAENLVALDVTNPMPLTDIFLIVSGRNERQVMAISDGIEDKLLENGVKLIRREGKSSGRWILLDFGYVIVHVMHEEERMYYSLERIWSDCPVVPLELVSAGESLS